MFIKRVFFALLIVGLALPALANLPPVEAQGGEVMPNYAVFGSYPVGLMEFDVQAPLHTTKIVVWYPAVYPPGHTINPGIPLEDAAPDSSGGPYPLVVYVTGSTAGRSTASWLGNHLASYGFVAIAMDPIDVAGGGYEEGAELLRRPQDVVWQIDYAESLTAAGGELEGMIDMDHVAVTGHSLGGYTALMAAGARIDWSFLPTWCSENYQSEYTADFGINFCDQWMVDMQSRLAPLADLDPSQAGLWPSWGDQRVDVIVSLSPSYWVILGPEGLGSISLPVLFIGGAKDITVPPDWDLFYENVSSTEKALVVLKNGDHYFPGDTKGHPSYCDLSRHFIAAFLLATLKGDQDAAAVLAADQVSFPEIEYQATGF